MTGGEAVMIIIFLSTLPGFYLHKKIVLVELLTYDILFCTVSNRVKLLCRTLQFWKSKNSTNFKKNLFRVTENFRDKILTI